MRPQFESEYVLKRLKQNFDRIKRYYKLDLWY